MTSAKPKPSHRPNLAASTSIHLKANDPRSSWLLQVNRSNSEHAADPAIKTIRLFEIGGYVGLFLLANLLIFMLWFEAARFNEKQANDIAEKTREAHAKTVEAERETRWLNEELEANMDMLSKAQQALVKHERLATLGQVTATLSHEIRNPLGAIRSSLYLLRQIANKANIKMDRPLDRIERSVCRCDNLIEDFLEYTRTNALSIANVDAAKFLGELLDEQALPASVELTRDIPQSGLRIAVDPDRFRRVVINLVENAAQAIAESEAGSGRINVSCSADADGSVIRVQDNGPGIPDDVLERIFEPLFTTKSFGAGLGLPTVKQLVEQHNAELRIDTEVGVGTTFTLLLPHPEGEKLVDTTTNDLEIAA